MVLDTFEEATDFVEEYNSKEFTCLILSLENTHFYFIGKMKITTFNSVTCFCVRMGIGFSGVSLFAIFRTTLLLSL